MGNNKSSRKDRKIRYFISEAERQLISEYWPKLKRAHPDVFVTSWLAAMEASPEIRQLFNISCPEDTLKSDSLTHTIGEVEDFFDQLVMRHRLELEPCRESCWILGAKHAMYSAKFKPYYWDVFSACLLYSLEEDIELKGRKRFELTMAWRRFTQRITEEMRVGYETEVEKRTMIESD